MKRILMGILVAAMLAVAIPLMPVQVEEAEARPDCQAVDQDGDGFVTSGDLSLVQSGPGESSDGRSNIIVRNIGTAC